MKKKKARFVFASLLIVSILCSMCLTALSEQPLLPLSRKVSDPEKPLKWVEFNVPYEPLKQAMDIDVDSYQDRIHAVSYTHLSCGRSLCTTTPEALRPPPGIPAPL